MQVFIKIWGGPFLMTLSSLTSGGQSPRCDALKISGLIQLVEEPPCASFHQNLGGSVFDDCECGCRIGVLNKGAGNPKFELPQFLLKTCTPIDAFQHAEYTGKVFKASHIIV